MASVTEGENAAAFAAAATAAASAAVVAVAERPAVTASVAINGMHRMLPAVRGVRRQESSTIREGRGKGIEGG